MPPISVLIKPSSGMCNMHCDYCFYCDETRKRQQESYGFMSEETLKNVIRKTILRAEGSISYAYQGGEPTLRGVAFFEKAVAFQKQYNKNNIRVSNALQTNGYAIDENWCTFLKENQFLVGVSVDGIQDTHDKYRHNQAGEGTHERVLHSIELFKQYGVEYNILTVVNCEVAEHIEEIYGFYKKMNWKYQQYIVCMEPLEETRGQKGYALQSEQYGQFLTRLFKLWESDFKQGKQPYIRQFDNYLGMLAGYPPEACDQRGICSVQYVVEADGSVYPCDFYMLDEYRLGNLNEQRLDQIDQKRLEIDFIERSKKVPGECRACRYFSLCRGGCMRNRDYDKQSDTYRNYFCEGFQIFFDNCLERMERIAKHK